MIIPRAVFNAAFARPENIRRKAHIPHLCEGVSPLLNAPGKMPVPMMSVHIDNAGEGAFAIRYIQVGGHIKIFPALIRDLADRIAVPLNDPGRPDVQIQFVIDRNAEGVPDLFAQCRRIPFRQFQRQFMQTGIFRRQQFQFFPFVTVEPFAPDLRQNHKYFSFCYAILITLFKVAFFCRNARRITRDLRFFSIFQNIKKGPGVLPEPLKLDLLSGDLLLVVSRVQQVVSLFAARFTQEVRIELLDVGVFVGETQGLAFVFAVDTLHALF